MLDLLIVNVVNMDDDAMKDLSLLECHDSRVDGHNVVMLANPCFFIAPALPRANRNTFKIVHGSSIENVPCLPRHHIGLL